VINASIGSEAIPFFEARRLSHQETTIVSGRRCRRRPRSQSHPAPPRRLDRQRAFPTCTCKGRVIVQPLRARRLKCSTASAKGTSEPRAESGKVQAQTASNCWASQKYFIDTPQTTKGQQDEAMTLWTQSEDRRQAFPSPRHTSDGAGRGSLKARRPLGCFKLRAKDIIAGIQGRHLGRRQCQTLALRRVGA